MADKKISQLNAHTIPTGSDELVIVSGGETKKITYSNFTGNGANYLSIDNISLVSGSQLSLDSYTSTELFNVSSGDTIDGTRGVVLPDASLAENDHRVLRFFFDYTWKTQYDAGATNQRMTFYGSGSQKINFADTVSSGGSGISFYSSTVSFFSSGSGWHPFSRTNTQFI